MRRRVVDPPAPPPGLDPARVAEIVATSAGGDVRRGSGFLVTGGAVLTAWHLVRDAATVRLGFAAGTAGAWSGDGGAMTRLGESDAVLIAVEPRPDVVPATVGGFAARRVAIDGEVAGYPRWKLRRGDGVEPVAGDGAAKHRDLAAEPGRLCPLSNPRAGGLSVHVTSPSADPDHPGTSPWEGMSGGPVFCQGALVGLITDHHRREGLGRLAAVRLDQCLEATPEPDLARVLDLLGVGSLAAVRRIGAPHGALLRSAYLEQVRDIAPAGGLKDREAELDRLARFCVGDEPYLVVRAGAGAGKTALLSSFALTPPAGVAVVSFFVTGRLAGQSDSTAFVDGLLIQLAALLDEALPPLITSGARDAYCRRLLSEASERVRAAGGRLVLLVDGLDEDTGAVPGSGLASIASLLPQRTEHGLKVIVAGRPDPPLPTDVRAKPDHPLRHTAPWLLTPSPYARGLLDRAEQELADLLAGPPLHVDVVGVVAASGGGLSANDLAKLTGMPLLQIRRLLNGPTGRTVAARADPATGEPGYLFTHETLQDSAAALLGPDALHEYRLRVHEWAEGYRDAGWPDATPRYLLTGYQQMVHASGDVQRLASLAADRARHDRMLDHTGGDHTALNELAAAMRDLADQARPDLVMLIRLARRREAITQRNNHIPTALPAVWAALGRPYRGEALARSMTDPDARAKALTELVYTLAPTAPDHAEALARSIADPAARARAICRLITTAAATDPERAALLAFDAEQLVRGIGDPFDNARLIAQLTEAVAAVNPARAEALARSGLGTIARDWTFVGLVRAFAATDPEHAEALARCVTDPAAGASALIELARTAGHGPVGRLAAEIEQLADGLRNPADRAMALTGLLAVVAATAPDHAARLVTAIEAVARQTEDLMDRQHALSELAWAAAPIAPDRAERVTDGIADPAVRIKALTELVRIVAPADRTRAARLADDVERLCQDIPEPAGRAKVLNRLVAVVAVADPGRASRLSGAVERTVADIGNPADRAWATTDLAWGVTATDPARAERFAVQAEQLARGIISPEDQALALTELIPVVARTAPGHVTRLASEAERLARLIRDRFRRARTLTGLMRAVVRLDAHHAAALALSIDEPIDRARALTDLVRALGATEPDTAAQLAAEAERLARAITHPTARIQAMTELVWTFATTDPDHAERLVREIAEPYDQIRALTELTSVAASRDVARAARLAAEAEQLVGGVRWVYDQERGREGLSRAVATFDLAMAEGLAASIPSVFSRSLALTDIARAVADADPAAAERIADGIPGAVHRLAGLTAVVKAVALTDPGRAAKLAADAERDILAIAHTPDRNGRLAALAVATAAVDPARAGRLARSVDNPPEQAAALIDVAKRVADGSRLVAEAVLVGDVWRRTLTAIDPDTRTAVIKDFLAELSP